MQIHLPTPPIREDGDFRVYVNGSGMKKGRDPFATIELADTGTVDLWFDTTEEIDRFITAACEAKRLLLAARIPHPYRPASSFNSGRCDECAVSKGHHLEPGDFPAMPDPVTVVAEAFSKGARALVAANGYPEVEHCAARPYPAGSEGDDGTECMLPAGHDGPHDDTPAANTVPRVSVILRDVLGDQAETAACGCPEANGMIRHQRATCTDPVAARLDWYADDDRHEDAR